MNNIVIETELTQFRRTRKKIKSARILWLIAYAITFVALLFHPCNVYGRQLNVINVFNIAAFKGTSTLAIIASLAVSIYYIYVIVFFCIRFVKMIKANKKARSSDIDTKRDLCVLMNDYFGVGLIRIILLIFITEYLHSYRLPLLISAVLLFDIVIIIIEAIINLNAKDTRPGGIFAFHYTLRVIFITVCLTFIGMLLLKNTRLIDLIYGVRSMVYVYVGSGYEIFYSVYHYIVKEVFCFIIAFFYFRAIGILLRSVTYLDKNAPSKNDIDCTRHGIAVIFPEIKKCFIFAIINFAINVFVNVFCIGNGLFSNAPIKHIIMRTFNSSKDLSLPILLAIAAMYFIIFLNQRNPGDADTHTSSNKVFINNSINQKAFYGD